MANHKYAGTLNEILASCKFNLPSENDAEESLYLKSQVDYSSSPSGGLLQNQNHRRSDLHATDSSHGSGPVSSSFVKTDLNNCKQVRNRVKTWELEDNIGTEHIKGTSKPSHARRILASSNSKRICATNLVWFALIGMAIMFYVEYRLHRQASRINHIYSETNMSQLETGNDESDWSIIDLLSSDYWNHLKYSLDSAKSVFAEIYSRACTRATRIVEWIRRV
ncbi:U21-like protein [Lissonota sp. PSUC_FEM 10030012]|nr:U21-like protein [Lissonota sp. PSUC_FEM 10030012]